MNGDAGGGSQSTVDKWWQYHTGNRLPIESAMDCKTSMTFIPFLAEEGVKLQSRRALDSARELEELQQQRRNIGNDVNIDVDVNVNVNANVGMGGRSS